MDKLIVEESKGSWIKLISVGDIYEIGGKPQVQM